MEGVTSDTDFDTVVADFEKPGDDFETLAERAADSGATHVVVTRDPPLAKWLDDYPEWPAGDPNGGPGADDPAVASDESRWDDDPLPHFDYDPYPSWYNHKLGLLKVLPPERLAPHVTDEWAAWADEVTGMLDRRCEILREHGLRAVYTTNEPQVLPERVFEAQPQWRGPRVDQPNRSRKPHFAPCVSHPAVLELYREAVAALLERYPEIEMFQFVTTDAGSGFCWAESLYPGENGNARCRDRSMVDRVTGFFDALDDGAERAGTAVEYTLDEIPPQEWMLPTFEHDERMATELDAGQALNNLEGPDPTPFQTTAGISNWEGSMLYPVRGIPQPVECVRSLQSAADSEAPRLTFGVSPGVADLHLEIYERLTDAEPDDRVEAFGVLKSLAADRVGEDHAGTLLELWFAIDEATTEAKTVPGHAPTMVGGVHQRWLTRPFVPFPLELDPETRRYYREYLFQAGSERRAENLVDCQAMRPFEGWAARLLLTFVFDRVDSAVERARTLASELAAELDGEQAATYEGLERRLSVLSCLLTNSRNAIDYQAIRDQVRERGVEPDPTPVLGTQSSWERDFMLDRARSEIDNTLELIDLLEGSDERILQCADSEAGEDIRLLGPNVTEELARKVEIMHDRWDDYRRLFTEPNP